MDKITVTLEQIRRHKPCKDGWKKLIKSLGGIKKYGVDTPITFQQIYNILGYDDTLWSLRVVDEKHYHLWRHFAVDCAEDVKHLMEDERSLDALKVARKYADGLASDEELEEASDKASTASTACAAASAAREAAWAARAACASASTASTASAAASAARAACAAASTASTAAWYEIKNIQMNRLFEYCKTGKRK